MNTTGLRGFVARAVWGMGGVASGARPRVWLPAAAAAGTFPLACGWIFGLPGQQWISAGCLFVLTLGLVRAQKAWEATGAVAVAFVGHSVLAIALAAYRPDQAAALLPGGEAYWRDSLHWIRTGQSVEAEVVAWLPAQLQLGAAAIVLGFVTLGLVPLYEGLYEVDLMNYYVGRLLTVSENPVLALGLGWHVWSVARGLCYTLLLYEIASRAFSLATGRPGSDFRVSVWRWGAALICFALDVGLKVSLTEAVRLAIRANLVPQ